jgi:hypothetical protein
MRAKLPRQPDNIWRIDCQLRDDEDSAEALRDANVTIFEAAAIRCF